jgi:hypothetical protein
MSRNVAGKHLTGSVYEIVSIVADSSVPYELFNYNVIVNFGRNQAVRITESVDLERESIGFVIDVGFDSSILQRNF